MKISYNNQTAFKKSLRAKCGIIKDGKLCRSNIYQLSKDEDKDYFKNLDKNSDWFDNNYLFILGKILQDANESLEPVYAMEDDKGNCIGVMGINSKNPNVDILEYIETMPKSAYGKQKRKYNFVGESFLAFLCKLTRQDDEKDGILINSYDNNAISFYLDNCGFKYLETPKRRALFLKEKDFDKLISKNEKRTGTTIDFFI